MSPTVETVQSELAGVVGDAGVTADLAACAAYAVDGQFPKWVVAPASSEEVAGLLRSAAAHNLAVIPCRNGTKLCIGNPPRRFDVALSLNRMNRVWHYEPDDLTVSVEPGMKLGDFQRFLGRRGLWLPLDPPGGPKASVGGILAANAAGPLRVAFGGPRDIALGVKVATTEGKIVKCGGRVVKNVAGYDLTKLLIGSYGTLGVVVEASLKLFPLPAERATFVFSLRNLDGARDLRRKLQSSPLEPLRMVVVDGLDRDSLLSDGHPEPACTDRPVSQSVEVWIEVGGTAKVIERYAREFEGLGRELGSAALRLESPNAERAWERLSDLRGWAGQVNATVSILKAILPIAATEEIIRHARQEAINTKLQLASVGQTTVGVAYICVWAPEDSPVVPGLVDRLRQASEGSGGTLVIEQASPALKALFDVWGAPGDDFEVQRKLKEAWDPKGILAPGRFIGKL